MYFLWYFVNQGQTVVFESVPKKATYVYRADGSCRKIRGHADDTVCPELDDENTIHLFDAKAGNDCYEPVHSKAFLMIFSSPNRHSYAQHERESVSTIGVPSYGDEEIVKAVKTLMNPPLSDAEIESKCAKYGNNLRLVLSAESQAVAVIAAALKRFNPNICDQYMDGTNGRGKDGSNPAVLLKLEKSGDEYPSVLATYRVENMMWSFASVYIRREVSQLKRTELQQMLTRFVIGTCRENIWANMRGSVFEPVAGNLIAAGIDVVYRPLHKSGSRDAAAADVKFGAEKLDVKPYRCTDVIDMLDNCKDATKLYCICGTMPAIDFFNPPNNFFQVTSSKDGHPINLNAMLAICGRIEGDINLYFVVSDDIYPFYKNEQSFKRNHVTRALNGLSEEDRLILTNLHQFALTFSQSRTAAL